MRGDTDADHACERLHMLRHCWLLRAGGGVTQIVMPYMTEGIAKHVPEYEAWRWAFFLPGCLFIIITFLILTLGQVRGLRNFRFLFSAPAAFTSQSPEPDLSVASGQCPAWESCCELYMTGMCKIQQR